jgi:hypothetical protein
MAMSLFSSIMDKIFHHSSGTATAAPAEAPKTAPQSSAPSFAIGCGRCDAATAIRRRRRSIDQARREQGRRRQLADVDRGFAQAPRSRLEPHRAQVARERAHVRAGADGSAEQNIALSKAVMQKLAENGGKVPESLRS